MAKRSHFLSVLRSYCSTSSTNPDKEWLYYSGIRFYFLSLFIILSLFRTLKNQYKIFLVQNYRSIPFETMLSLQPVGLLDGLPGNSVQKTFNMIQTFHNQVISIDELWQFFNRSANLFCVTNAAGYLRHVNPHVSALLGFSETELLATPFLDLIHREDKEYFLDQLEKARMGVPTIHLRTRILLATSGFRRISWTATYHPEEDNMYLIGQDYTETYEMEEKLKQEKLSKQQSVLEANLMGQEKERSEIGKELHDNINQILATSILYHNLALLEKDKTEELIRQSMAIVNQAINEIRALSKSLVGPNIRQLSLIDCIQELLDTLEMGTDIDVEFNWSGDLECLPEKVKLMIFRIVQEQLNNIQKHAKAKKVVIELLCNKKFLALNITDDGVGFDTQKKRNGIGLNNIISRVELYNGTLIIDSALGTGCSLTMTVPVASMLTAVE
jgi:PAS domain S-box-containing protein